MTRRAMSRIRTAPGVHFGLITSTAQGVVTKELSSHIRTGGAWRIADRRNDPAEDTLVAIVAHDAVRQPPHPDGHSWLVVWVGSDGDAIFADSLSDIVAVLIDGYDELDDEHEDDLHLQARIDYLVPLASHAQTLTLTDLAQQGVHLSEEELTAAMASKELPVRISRWNPAEPLVLLTTAYEPYTDDTAPEGSILWLDPTNESAFLGSLAKVGVGELWVTGG